MINTKEIARICGLSRGTVDRALNGRPGINAETKERILKVASELGYQPHLLARSLVTGRTMTIGMIIFDLSHRFFSQIVTVSEKHAREKGYIIIPAMTYKHPEEEKKAIERLVGLNVDGIIVFSVNQGRRFESYLRAIGKPIVTMGNRISRTFDFVGIDDRAAAKDAVDHIAKKGYERILFLCPPLANPEDLNIYEVEQRHLGFKDGVREHGLAEASTVIKGKNYLSFFDTFDFSAKKTAILCQNDTYALNLLKLFKRKGVRVPEEAGLMGFDNIDTLEYVEPRITTVDYHIEEIGRTAVDLLLNQIQGTDPGQTALITHTIVEGTSLSEVRT